MTRFCFLKRLEKTNQHQKLIDALKDILKKAINTIKGGVKIADVGFIMETEAKKRGFKVIKILVGMVSGEAFTSSRTN